GSAVLRQRIRPRFCTVHSAALHAKLVVKLAASLTRTVIPSVVPKASGADTGKVPRASTPAIRLRARPFVCNTDCRTDSAASFASHGSPIPSASRSRSPTLAMVGQLSSASQMPSPSVSALPGAHTPARQLGDAEHPVIGVPQAVPSGAGTPGHSPVNVSQVPATWHSVRPLLQSTGLLPTQLPAWQVSVCIHASPSVQVVPSGLLGFEHSPVAGVQVPRSLHWSTALQTSGLIGGFEHRPVFGLHVPALWQRSIAVQTISFSPTHVPAWQVSVCVQ